MSRSLTADQLDAPAAAIADATRRGILQRLAHGPATAGQLASLFTVSRPAVSRHLQVLRNARLVRATQRGRFLWYEADPAPLGQLQQWIHDTAKRIADAPPLSGKEHP